MKFSHSVMDNGFNVVTDYVPEARAASVRWLIRAGSRHDDVPGTAHFFEHMFAYSLCAAGGKPVIERFKEISPYTNFTTGPEAIEAYADVLPVYVPEVIKTLGAIVAKPVWNASIFEKQKALILNEYDEDVVTQYVPLRQLSLQKMFVGSAAARLVLGERHDIHNMTEENLLAYKHKHFLAGDMVLVVSGPLQHEDVVAMAQQCFSELPAGKNVSLARPQGTSGHYQLVVKPKDEQLVVLCAPGHDANAAGYHASEQMMSVLGMGINDFLRDNGYSYQGIFRSFASGFSDFGLNLLAIFSEPTKASASTLAAAHFIASPELWLTEEKYALGRLRADTGQALGYLNLSDRVEAIVRIYTTQGKIRSYEDIIAGERSVEFQDLVNEFERFRQQPLCVLGDGPCTELPSPQEVNDIIRGVPSTPAVAPAAQRGFDLV